MVVARDVFAQALRLHLAGRVDEAERAYDTLVAPLPPGGPDSAVDAGVLRFLALAARQTGAARKALEVAARALPLCPDSAVLHNDLALTLEKLGHREAATALARRAVALRPDFAAAHYNLARLLKAAGDTDLAFLHMEQALAARWGLGDAAVAEAEALGAAPRLAEVLGAMGDAMAESGRLEAAARCFHHAALSRPDDPAAHFSLGRVLAQAGRDPEAAVALDRAAVLDPANACAQLAAGFVLLRLGRPAEAVAPLRQVAALHPDDADAFRCLGDALLALGRHEEGLDSYGRAAALSPDDRATYGMGECCRALGRLDEAMRAYAATAVANPRWPPAYYHLGLSQLQAGAAAGWRGYEWRWLAGAVDHPPRHDSIPRWDGGPLAGKRLLAWGEQGLAEQVFFARWLASAGAAGLSDPGLLVVECDPLLAPLFRRSFPHATVVETGADDAPRADVQVPFGSLPLDVAAQPSGACLHAEAARVAGLRQRFAADHDGVVVALAWRGPAGVALADLAPVLAVPGVRFVAVEGPDAEAEIAAVEAELGVVILRDPHFDPDWNIEGLAGYLAAVDLVVCVDGLTPVLAGALGCPTWTLLPSPPRWLWPVSGEASPWYPGHRLFHQGQAGDWAAPVAAMAGRLAGLRR